MDINYVTGEIKDQAGNILCRVSPAWVGTMQNALLMLRSSGLYAHTDLVSGQVHSGGGRVVLTLNTEHPEWRIMRLNIEEQRHVFWGITHSRDDMSRFTRAG